jgi:1-acyl-sn-glycerol-3-phosphate acyltransferase
MNAINDFLRPWLRRLFAVCVAWPICLVTPNHNSHLDTAAMLTIFPLSVIPSVRPVAAADYFLKGGLMSWFSQNLVGIIPIVRKRPKVEGESAVVEADPLQGCYDALERGDILIIFPEGTRGEPEQMQALKSGVAVLASKYPDVPVVPIFMHGLGKAMPKGTFIPVPFFVDVNIGLPLRWKDDSSGGDKKAFMAEISSRMKILSEKRERPEYE